MLTPADINNKQFNTTRIREGYDQNEVDAFLDDVQAAFAVVSTAAARLEVENGNLKRIQANAENAITTQIPMTQAPSALAEKLLAAAQVAHDEHIAEAKAKADEIVREAGAQAARLVEEASAAAERLKNEGLTEKYRRNEELEAKASKLNEQILDLNDRGVRVKQALTAALGNMEGVS